ncbi:hypothetical protein EBZ39_02500 [bacterium]|nr:hypothetical protein [bacterium]
MTTPPGQIRRGMQQQSKPNGGTTPVVNSSALPASPPISNTTIGGIKSSAAQPEKKKPSILDELRSAKTHSDRREYDRKHEILRRLIAQSPQDWHVDDPKPKYKGITHTPTKFRFHAPRGVIGSQVKAAENSVYAQQFGNLLNFRTPFVFDHNKPVYENVVDHLLKAPALRQRCFRHNQKLGKEPWLTRYSTGCAGCSDVKKIPSRRNQTLHLRPRPRSSRARLITSKRGDC